MFGHVVDDDGMVEDEDDDALLSSHPLYCVVERERKVTKKLTFSHLADALIQSDLQ